MSSGLWNAKAFLIIEDYCKGEQVVYDIPLEEDFDIDKLRLKVYDVGCRVEVINEIIYDEKSYEIYKKIKASLYL